MADREKLKARFEELKASMEVGLFGTVGMDEVEAVLELIRETEPRVLTLEECRHRERIVVVENKVLAIGPDYHLTEGTKIQKRAMYIGKIWNGETEWSQFACFRCYMDYIQFPTNEYGRTWRCWSALPSDEARKEVKWDD